MLRSLVGSEMCIRDSINAEYGRGFRHGSRDLMGCEHGKEEKQTEVSKETDGSTKNDSAGPKKDGEGKYLRPTDAAFLKMFSAFDTNDSKTLRTKDEIRQLTFGILIALEIQDIKNADVKEIVEDLPEDTVLSFQEYKDWLFTTFNFSDKTRD
eukprot:TRINITY_DN28265_c0_g1_i1.p1 TRINITY_DN28265_c0_g1~~TRINITY_DN28265_c0_g1_i1.p1  ORF type:complete len:153 (-),score=52.76 TRINITY_DN28265_c0_g1_i1:514-972(-)